MNRIKDFLNEENRADTMIIRGTGFLANVLVIVAVIKYLI